MLQQQDKFEDFIHQYSYDRPHEALNMKTPGPFFQASEQAYQGLPDLQCHFHDKSVVITECGRLSLDRKKIHISTVLAGQRVGIGQVEDQIWQVSFMDYGLRCFDMESGRLDPGPNPFGPKVLTM